MGKKNKPKQNRKPKQKELNNLKTSAIVNCVFSKNEKVIVSHSDNHPSSILVILKKSHKSSLSEIPLKSLSTVLPREKTWPTLLCKCITEQPALVRKLVSIALVSLCTNMIA